MAAEQLLSELNVIRTRARELVYSLNADQLTHRPDPAKWSIAECFEHLNLTAAAVQPRVAEAIERGKRENITGTGPFSPGMLGRLAIWMAEPPPKFRLRAPKNIAPKLAGDPLRSIADFMNFQDGWEKLVRDCEGLDQSRITVPGLFPGLPPLRLAAPVAWMLAHQRRHLWQAENVKRQITQSATAKV